MNVCIISIDESHMIKSIVITTFVKVRKEKKNTCHTKFDGFL